MNKRTIITGARILALVALMLLMLGVANVSTAASPLEVEWSKVISNGQFSFGNCGRETSDGGYIIVGQTFNPNQVSVDIYIVKLDRQRDVVWTKNYGGGGKTSVGYAVEETSGGYLVGGESEILGNGGGIVFKVDYNGNTIWPQPVTFGGPGCGYVAVIYPFNDGSCIAGGWITPGNRGTACLIRISPSGQVVWQKIIPGCASARVNGLVKTYDGGFVAVGDVWTDDVRQFDVYLAKLDADCNTVWVKNYGGNDFDVGQSVQQTQDNGFIIAGYAFSFSANDKPDGYVIRTDSSGKLVWQKTYGGLERDWFFSVQTITDGYVLVGSTTSFGNGVEDGWIVKLDWNGNQTNQLTFGTADDDSAANASSTLDGGCLITGNIRPNVYITKIKAPITGVKRWAKYE